VIDHHLGRTTLVSFGLPGEGKNAAKTRVARLKSEVMTALREPSAASPSAARRVVKAAAPKIQAALGRGKFGRAISRIRRHIKDGDIFQCVLSERFQFKLRSEPFAVYRSLRSLGSSPYLYYLNLGHEVILGASPETLVRFRGGKVSTFPIA